MIYPGTDLKFRVTADIAGFSLTDDDFVIAVKDRHMRTRYTIPKDECFQDSAGGWLFTVEDVKGGVYTAVFTGFVPDMDYDKMVRRFVDVRRLCAVGCCDDRPECRCDCGGHRVRYEQVWLSDLDDGTYLCDADGALVLTEDGARIKVAR